MSHVLRHKKLQSDHNLVKSLIRTMSHEQLTPLNAVLNLSEHTLACLNDGIEVSTEDLKYWMETIRSSAKILEYGTQS